MSGHRGRLTSSSTRPPYAKETAMGKENVCLSNKSNKLLAGTNSQKVVPRRRFFSEDLMCVPGCHCTTAAKNNAATTEFRSLAGKTPFRIRFDRAGNGLKKGACFRERIVEYNTRRTEELKGHVRIFENKIEKAVELTSRQRAPLVEKQQTEANLARDRGQNLKESKAIVRNLVVPGNKPIIKSIKTISGVKLSRPRISTARSLVDLSQVNKPSASGNKACDIAKKNAIKSIPVESNLGKKRSSSIQSINKPNHLTDGWNRAHPRSRSCSNQRLVTKNEVISSGSTKERSVNVQKKQIGSEKYKKLGGSRDSLISGSCNIFSCDSSKKKISWAGKGYQNREDTKKDLIDLNSNIPSVSGERNLNDRTEEPLVDATPEKAQAKVESDLRIVKHSTDFSAYLLYDTAYLVDLLSIEMGKEMNAPKLSLEFIDKYGDNESRNLVVGFLIHLSSHRRYSSCILYQAVKLFDVIIDRVSIEKTDLQLTAITALWIVLKKDGNFNKIPSAKSMLSLVPDLQDDSVNTLAEWERMALRALNFNITFSDPFSIFVFYVINYDYGPDSSSSIITKIYYCGGYVIDLTLLDAKFSYTSSNHLALVTAELVMSIILDDEAYLAFPRWDRWRRIITNGIQLPIRIYDDEINLLRATMINRVLESAKKHTKEEVVRKRYSRSRYSNIADFFISKVEKISPTEYSMCM